MSLKLNELNNENRVLFLARANIIKNATPLTKEEPLQIINDYLGFETEQYQEIQDKKAVVVFDRFIGQSKQELSRDPKANDKDKASLEQFISQMNQHFFSLPCIQEASLAFPLDVGIAQTAVLGLIQALYQSPDLTEKLINEPLQALHEPFSDCVLEKCVTESSKRNLEDILKHALKCRNAMRQSLPSLVFERGSSKGFLFKIQKKGTTRGYLYGTMHYLVTEKLKKAADCTLLVQKKLSHCVIIGTEIKVKDDKTESVEGRLLDFAKKNGIVSFGIDTPLRDEWEKELEVEPKKEGVSVQESIDFAHAVLETYCAGNFDAFTALLEKTVHHESPKFITVHEQRNSAIADNIDLFLKSFESIAHKENGEIHRAFFGVGSSHLAATKLTPGSIPKLLREKGWDVRLVKQQ